MKCPKHIIFLWAILAFILESAPCSEVVPAESLTPAQVLAHLPDGAKLADDIPLVQFGTPEETKQTRPNVFYADLDSDGQNEIIVAYYTKPHQPIVGATEAKRANAEAYFRRAHVRVLDWNGTRYVERWDSGGFGMHFIAGMDSELPAPKQCLYTANYFHIRDINGDGRPEILFTRASYVASGTLFRAWSWDGTTYTCIARLRTKVRIEDIDGDGTQEIIRDHDYNGLQLAAPIIYKWDGSSYAAKAEK